MILDRTKTRLGKAIQQMRQDHGLSVEQMATMAEMRPQDLYAIERGAKAASLIQIHAIVKAIDSDMLALMEKASEIRDVNVSSNINRNNSYGK
ncbi:MAG: helix-turn-helix transcriptional regulator [Cyanobacteria bacterium HKST-UBA01]|nr:helix-turn-helix transcriptional regulator [Cyanobacteria bacterium HKST-UBA01]